MHNWKYILMREARNLQNWVSSLNVELEIQLKFQQQGKRENSKKCLNRKARKGNIDERTGEEKR